jgi:hypothetical protein
MSDEWKHSCGRVSTLTLLLQKWGGGLRNKCGHSTRELSNFPSPISVRYSEAIDGFASDFIERRFQ